MFRFPKVVATHQVPIDVTTFLPQYYFTPLAQIFVPLSLKISLRP